MKEIQQDIEILKKSKTEKILDMSNKKTSVGHFTNRLYQEEGLSELEDEEK